MLPTKKQKSWKSKNGCETIFCSAAASGHHHGWRWAKQRGLARSEGHKQGSETFRKIGEYAGNLGIRYITFYAFSTENWNRPETEVNAIMNLFDSFLTEAIDRLDENIEKGIRLHFLGDKSGLPDELRSLMDFVEEQTKHCNKVHLNLAISRTAGS